MEQLQNMISGIGLQNMSKGITLSREEMEELYEVLGKTLGK